MNKPLLQVTGLKKYFKTPAGMLYAVDDISFSLNKGQTLGIVGESGCGKSTLGRVILHLLNSNGGKIFFGGADITHISSAEINKLRRDMQIIFQDPFSSLNPRMTVSEIIGEPLILVNKLRGQNLQKQVRMLMDTVGLAPQLINTYPHELDGGRRQRIGIARALALNPQFIVCDEPVSALDVSIQAQILNLLLDLQEERALTYLFISHDLAVVKYISDYICVMYLGQIVEQAPAAALFAKPLHPYTQALLSAILTVDLEDDTERILLKGELASAINPPLGCRFAPRCLYAQNKCYQQQQLRNINREHLVRCCLV